MKLSKTAAIKEARTFVGSLCGRHTSWSVFGPYLTSNLHGPSTEAHADSYTKARRIRTIWVAQIDVALMGREEMVNTIDYLAQVDGQEGLTVESLVAAAIKEDPRDY